jgi:hypothetical protein
MAAVLQSIPCPMKIRDELEQMVLSDLLGPVGGAKEEISEPSVRDRYLVGMLAPKRQDLSPEEFDELPQGGSGSPEDGITDYTAPTMKTMSPSSFGLTFCLDPEAKSPQVTARWGQYRRDQSATLATKVIPTYEVPRTMPPTNADWPKLSGLVVDMKELGESSTSELDKKVRSQWHLNCRKCLAAKVL